MSLFQIGDGQAQIFLGGGQRAMAEDFLHMPQVGVVLEQVRGAGVPPQVTGDMLFDSGPARVSLDDMPDAMLADGFAGPHRDKEPICLSVFHDPSQGHLALEKFRTDGFDVVFEEGTGNAAQRNHAIFCAFATVDPQKLLFQVHVFHGEIE